MKRVLKGFLILSVLMTALAGYVGYAAWQWLHQSVGRELVVEVVQGDSVRTVEARLSKHGFIKWPRIWSWYAQFVQPEPIQAGEYAILAFESLVDVLSKMQTGKVLQHKVTFVEGASVEQILKILQEHPAIKQTLTPDASLTLSAKLNLSYPSAEGWIFPDTYYFTRNTTDIDILKRAVNKMKTVLAEEWEQRDEALPFNDPYQALILASIVEKETGAGDERGKIAGVFVRRLKVDMRLQTDPTVIYGMGSRYKGNITKQDLLQDTPYNTYTRGGLTPTPIASPGRAAIHAALNPEPGTALYFVAKGNGTHHFSDTLTDHNWAVRRYQIGRIDTPEL